MDISVFVSFNGKVTTYNGDEEVVQELTGDIRILHDIVMLSNNRDAAKIYLGDRINKVVYFFQHKDEENFTNIKVNKGQIKQLLKYIIPSDVMPIKYTITNNLSP